MPTSVTAVDPVLKDRIRAAHTRAALSVNRELVHLYWVIEWNILQRQEREGWGAKVLDRFTADLHATFPKMHGLSARNLSYMQGIAVAYPDKPFVQQVVAQMP